MKFHSSEESVYLGQLNDLAHTFGLTNKANMGTALKLNALFFDNIILSITQLLGNQSFFKLQQTDPEGFERLFTGGVLQPAYLYRGDSEKQEYSIDVAERMISSKSEVQSKSAQEILSHAEFIDKHRTGIVEISDSLYRENSRSTMLDILSNDQNLSDKITRDILYSIDGVEILTESYIWRLLDKFCVSKVAQNTKAKINTANLHILATMSGSELSTSNYQTEILMGLFQKKEISKEPLYTETLTEISTEFDLETISILSLKDIMELRNTEQFLNFRRSISQARLGKSISESQLQFTLNSCQNTIREYSHGSPMIRKSILNVTPGTKNIVKLMCYAGSLVPSLILFTKEIRSTPEIVASLIAFGAVLTSDIYNPMTSSTGFNVVKGDVKYTPAQGALHFKKCKNLDK